MQEAPNLDQTALKQITDGVEAIAEEAAAFIQSQAGKLSEGAISNKGVNDFVTRVDQESEALIVARLSDLLKDSDFMAEENTAGLSGKPYTWVIDPLDGTTNFIHGLPCYCVSIALVDQQSTLLSGVVYEVNARESFTAFRNGGARLNGKPIHVSERNKLADSLLVTGFPYTDFSRIDEYLALFRHLMQYSRGIRRLGSAAADLAYVAAGRCEAFYEYSLKAWDVAAGALLVMEAGGKVTDFNGGNGFLFEQQLIASNSDIYDELQEVILGFMG